MNANFAEKVKKKILERIGLFLNTVILELIF